MRALIVGENVLGRNSAEWSGCRQEQRLPAAGHHLLRQRRGLLGRQTAGPASGVPQDTVGQLQSEGGVWTRRLQKAPSMTDSNCRGRPGRRGLACPVDHLDTKCHTPATTVETGLSITQERTKLSALQRLVVLEAAGWQVGAAAVGERGLRSGVLVGVVVLPLDAHRALVPNAVQFDENILQ